MPRLIAAVLLVLAQGPPHALPPGGTRSSELPISDVAMVSWVAQRSPGTLALAVVWRGAPGWYRHGGHAGSSGGGSQRQAQVSIERGGVSLQADIEFETRIAHVNGKIVRLGDDNVILVDNVEQPTSRRVVRTLHVDPSMPSDGSPLDIVPVLARSPEIIAFAHCDVPNPDGWCARLVAARR